MPPRPSHSANSHARGAASRSAMRSCMGRHHYTPLKLWARRLRRSGWKVNWRIMQLAFGEEAEWISC